MLFHKTKALAQVLASHTRVGDQSAGVDRVMAFAGALDGHGASKGVLITTSRFTADAQAFRTHARKMIVLIDGARLADLMMDFGVGVT